MPDGGARAAAAETVAFAGASLSTVGARLAEPAAGTWDILSAVAAMNGMIMLTLSVSFIMNVWQTTRHARSVALRIAALEGLAPRLSDDTLADELGSISAEFAGLVVAIRATPVVGSRHRARREMSLPLAVPTICAHAPAHCPIPSALPLSCRFCAMAVLTRWPWPAPSNGRRTRRAASQKRSAAGPSTGALVAGALSCGRRPRPRRLRRRPDRSR